MEILKLKTEEGVTIPSSAVDGSNLMIDKLLESEGIGSKSLASHMIEIVKNPDMRKEYISLIAEKLWKISVIAEKGQKDCGYNLM